MKRALFLDRDGVLNVDTGYIGEPDRIVLIPGVISFLQRAKALGYLLVIVTNQSGLARGYFTEKDYCAVTERLRLRFLEHGVEFAGIYHCPHHPDGQGPLAVHCACRKPLPGLILQAGEELGIDLEQSIMVGDKSSDVAAGTAAGLKKQFLLRHPDPGEEAGETNLFAEVEEYLDAIDGCATRHRRAASRSDPQTEWRMPK